MKLAEDMVTRGSVNSTLIQFLQSHLGAPQPLNTQNLHRGPNVSPTITVTVHGDDASYAGMTVSGQNPVIGLGHTNINNSNMKTGIMSNPMLNEDSLF